MNTILPSEIQLWIDTLAPDQAWQKISRTILTPDTPFDVHLALFTHCYPEWETRPETAALWQPDIVHLPQSALHACLQESGCTTVKAFHRYSVTEPEKFWARMLKRLNIRFNKNPEKICDLSQGAEHPVWLAGARLNIVDSCFMAPPDKAAIIQKEAAGPIQVFTYGELEVMVNRIAGGLLAAGYHPGDAIGLIMPMHFIAVACFLAIIRMGGKVVSIAESFSPEEIARRLSLGNATCIMTQDHFVRDNKSISLYQKTREASTLPAIIYSVDSVVMRSQDTEWNSFLQAAPLRHSFPCDATTHSIILFSSGTTGAPKTIPWTHATPLKSASDALLHHNLRKEDVISWPTSLGWMMGPWLVFAGFINQATLALYTDSPLDRKFARFVEASQVTVQGVVPTLVAHWRKHNTLQGCDWNHIRLFTSTGECSNPQDMLYLSSRAQYAPIIEYCGGTEIGGAYISSTLLEKNCPCVFTTPAMGSDFVLLNESGEESQQGEVALLPPAMGLSLTLLNADHHAIYFADMPQSKDHRILRRHGDYLQRLEQGGYRALGRNDDTMNLSGIKISSIEIERALVNCPLVTETAAVSRREKMGPEQLVIYAITLTERDPEILKKNLQQEINTHLNPLFRICEVIVVDELPKTISGKIMRRLLRKQ